ncbi:hypothetical protein TNCV_2553841 [Trichonephila clavipes]|nr:hypothetical protein TNCV_2553841 [Trichonephila clavipes]
MELEERETLSSPLHPKFLLRQPTRFSDLLIQRACTPCVLEGYLVAWGIEPRTSDLESDALTTRLLTAIDKKMWVVTVALWSRKWTCGWCVMSSSLVPMKTPSYRGRCMESMSKLKRSPNGVVWKLGEVVAISGVVVT